MRTVKWNSNGHLAHRKTSTAADYRIDASEWSNWTYLISRFMRALPFETAILFYDGRGNHFYYFVFGWKKSMSSVALATKR